MDYLILLWLRKQRSPKGLWFTVLTKWVYSSRDVHTILKVKVVASPGFPSLTPCFSWGLIGLAWLHLSMPSCDAQSGEVETGEKEAAKNCRNQTHLLPYELMTAQTSSSSLCISPGCHPIPTSPACPSKSCVDAIMVSFSGKWSGSLHCRAACWNGPERNSASRCIHHFYKTSLFWNSKWHVWTIFGSYHIHPFR